MGGSSYELGLAVRLWAYVSNCRLLTITSLYRATKKRHSYLKISEFGEGSRPPTVGCKVDEVVKNLAIRMFGARPISTSNCSRYFRLVQVRSLQTSVHRFSVI